MVMPAFLSGAAQPRPGLWQSPCPCCLPSHVESLHKSSLDPCSPQKVLSCFSKTCDDEVIGKQGWERKSIEAE